MFATLLYLSGLMKTMLSPATSAKLLQARVSSPTSSPHRPLVLDLEVIFVQHHNYLNCTLYKMFLLFFLDGFTSDDSNEQERKYSTSLEKLNVRHFGLSRARSFILIILSCNVSTVCF